MEDPAVVEVPVAASPSGATPAAGAVATESFSILGAQQEAINGRAGGSMQCAGTGGASLLATGWLPCAGRSFFAPCAASAPLTRSTTHSLPQSVCSHAGPVDCCGH